MPPLARQGISVTWAYNSVIAASRTLTTTCSYFSYSNNFNKLALYTTEEMSKVETDISKLLELGLVERNEAVKVFVPWDEVQIWITLGRAAAA